jgi:hypothetical protein
MLRRRQPKHSSGPYDSKAAASREARLANERLGGPGWREDVGGPPMIWFAMEMNPGRWYVSKRALEEDP